MIIDGKEYDENTLEARRAKSKARKKKPLGEQLYGKKKQDEERMEAGE